MLMMYASNGGGVTYLMENVAVIMRSNEWKGGKKKEKGKDEASWEEKQN